MANSIDQNKKFSVMWPTKEDRKKITSFDSIFILRFTSTYYHLLGTNNKRFHIIIAWCSLVMYGLFDPLELEKLNATSEVNLFTMAVFEFSRSIQMDSFWFSCIWKL